MAETTLGDAVKSSVVAVAMVAFALSSFSARAQTYTYDNLGRVASVVQPNGTKTIYFYDNADNRTGTQTALSGTTTMTAPAASPTILFVTTSSSLLTVATNAGYGGSATANYKFIVPAGTTIVGGITTGTWTSGVTLSLVVNGTVYGNGGTGGDATCTPNVNGGAGGNGGDAIYVTAPIAIAVNTGGAVIASGGGGGGGTPYGVSNGHGGSSGQCGSGGGGGFPNGSGGHGIPSPPTGFTATTDGSPGTLAGGGAGGTGGLPGGTGGGANATGGHGANGNSLGVGGVGGAPGYAIRKNGNTVTVTGSGTITGTVG